MMSGWKAVLFAGAAIITINPDAFAQNLLQAPAPVPTISQAGLYDPKLLPAQRGQVQQFTLTPLGHIDGLILSDGTEVKTSPDLSTEIADAVKAGDMVTIHGLRAAALPLVQAVSITDEQTGRTIVDNGVPGLGHLGALPPLAPQPAAPDAGPAAPIPGLSEVQGRVRMSLHGVRGNLNGALLDDGTVLRLPPPEARRFANLLRPGQTLVAEGTWLATAVGKVFEVQQIGASREQLSLVETLPELDSGRDPPAP